MASMQQKQSVQSKPVARPAAKQVGSINNNVGASASATPAVPSASSPLKFVVIAVVAIVAIALLLFFVNKGTGHAINFGDDAGIAANMGGVFLADGSTIPVDNGAADLLLPLKINFESRSVAVQVNYHIEASEGAIFECDFALRSDLQESGLVVLNDQFCSLGQDSHVEIAFLCADAECSNAFSGVEEIGQLRLTPDADNTEPISVTFDSISYVDFEDVEDRIVDVAVQNAALNYAGEPPACPPTDCASEGQSACQGNSAWGTCSVNVNTGCLEVSNVPDENRCGLTRHCEVGACVDNPPFVCVAAEGCIVEAQCTLGGFYWYADVNGVETCHAEDAPQCDNTIDADSDGVGDACDNCPALGNGNQIDLDADSIGDSCDNDKDGDTIPNSDEIAGCDIDNSPECGSDNTDFDSDGVLNDVDNCPNLTNANQADSDADRVGDACDGEAGPNSDFDVDGVIDTGDNCPRVANADQADLDADGVGDNCDNCRSNSNADQVNADSDALGDACDVCSQDDQNDRDADGICGNVDNCPATSNPLQEDVDADGIGEACNGIPRVVDNEVVQSMDGLKVKVVEGGKQGSVFTTLVIALEPIDTPFTVYTTLLDADGVTIVFESRTIQSLEPGNSFRVHTDGGVLEVVKKEVIVNDNLDPATSLVHLNGKFSVSYGNVGVN